jgi:hypothetical protein
LYSQVKNLYDILVKRTPLAQLGAVPGANLLHVVELGKTLGVDLLADKVSVNLLSADHQLQSLLGVTSHKLCTVSSG